MTNLSAYFVNSSLFPTSVDGVITADSNNMEIYFRDEQDHIQYSLNSIIISCPDDSPYPTKLKINNTNSILIVPIGGEEMIEGLNILKLTYVGTANGKFSFKGLSDIVSGSFFDI